MRNAAMESGASFGYWVRRRRKALDLTQDALARSVGCAVITLRKIEAGERHPSRQMAVRLAQCLILPPEERAVFLAAAGGERSSRRLPPADEASIGATAGGLPMPLAPLVGRSGEVTAIINRLRGKDQRLLTLTGPVGVGKTRLAIEAGRRLQHEFRGGVHLVELGALEDPALVPAMTAAVLGVREEPGRSLVNGILQHLAQKETLLIFDQFEHLQPAAGFLAELLQGTPGLRLLVTSRAVLRLYGEQVFFLKPLPLPEKDAEVEAPGAAAVRLFCERAQALQAEFRLTPDLVPVVAEICRRLDGLPLAIEQSAACINLFSPQEILQQVEQRLSLPGWGAAVLPANNEEMEDAITRSYVLLAPGERTVLNRLGVFVNGFTLLAAGEICAFPCPAPTDPPRREAGQEMPDVPGCLATLMNHSLLLRQNTGPVEGVSRYWMLETIRGYALEQLAASGELEQVRQRHADHYLAWAAQSRPRFSGLDRATWLARVEEESDNLQAALDWLLKTGQVGKAASLGRTLKVLSRPGDGCREGSSCSCGYVN